MSLRKSVIPVLVMFSSVTAYPISDHSPKNIADIRTESSTHTIKNTPSIQELFQLTDLIEAVEVTKDSNGEYFVRAKNTPAGEQARRKLRSALEGIQIFNELESIFENEIEISVYDKKNSVISKQKAPVLGAALVAALSVPSRDKFPNGTRLFLRDASKKLTSLSLMSQDSESTSAIKTNFLSAKNWARDLNLNFSFTQQYQATEPPEQFFSWNKDSASFSIENNQEARELWEAREAVAHILTQPDFADKLKQLKSSVSDAHNNADVTSEQFLFREDVAPLAYGGANQNPKIGKILRRSISRFLRANDNPNDPSNFHIEKRRLNYRESVVTPKTDQTPRVAFVYPDGNSALRKNTARANGFTHIYDISHPSQAIPIIKKLYEKTGKPIEVGFCSHGSPGMLVMANPSSSEIDRLTQETRGMVSSAYALGCSVGSQASNTARPHLLRELSVGWGVPVSAVDQTLYLDNQKWYLQGSGNLITVTPEGQDINPKELIDSTPVWKIDTPFEKGIRYN